mgnify:CR=1 FL=1
MTVGGNVINIKNPENVGNQVFHLCSEGNRKIIQSSVRKAELKDIAKRLNDLQLEFSGIDSDKFYVLE